MSEKTVEEQIADAVAKSESGLKAKNAELLKKLKASKGLSDTFDGVDLEQLQKDSKELAKRNKTKDEDEGNYKKLYTAQAQQHQEAIDASDANSSALLKTLNSERTSNALTSALVASHVEPDLVSAASIILAGNVAINDEGVAMVGDKTVSEHVSEWAVSSVGKHFVQPSNSGGGATGGGNAGSADAVLFDPNSPHYNVTAQAQLYKRDPKLYQTLKDAAPNKK